MSKIEGISRRHFLTMLSRATGTLAAGTLLGACGAANTAATPTDAAVPAAAATDVAVPAAPAPTTAPAAPAASEGGDWSAAPDVERAKAQAAEFQTYGMPDDWANYGEVIKLLADKHGFTVNRTDTDMSSLEEITKFDAEKNNPAAIAADIGLLYSSLADQRGVVPAYMPPNAAKLPANLKGPNGGWVATFTGVPAFVVNTDVVKNVPRTWDDLLKPEYKGQIGFSNPATSGTGATTFVAWAYALGGSETNLESAVEYGKKIAAQAAAAEANAQSLEKGEVPIQLKYDFNCAAAAEAVKAKGINAEVVIPGVSIYAPSALMLNKYFTAKMDLAKLLIDFVLSDEAQTTFAKFGARPIRAVIGDLELPADAKAKWLPDDQYSQVKQIADWSKVDPAKIADIWTNQVLA